MKLFKKTKDGGPESPVDAYFLIEIKNLFSIALLKFNYIEGSEGRRTFHSHAFNAFTWFISGNIAEETYNKQGFLKQYKRSLLPKITKRSLAHRVIINKDSWCLTIRGSWNPIWFEFDNNIGSILTYGRRILARYKI